ncbi:MAG: GntR family transcriptional regulator [Clostridiales bacterium GWE2_32_10]|nr:MAG: GntR family transcriptional regulator [Clostridiales bacterium GWE2_32_10]HBY20658.1 GntR family transcriptional regulator [Clostridiales bacterium]
MFQVDLKSRESIYEQVMKNIKRLIISDVLKKDDKVPSVRQLATSISVNPNTIQKAYRELEREGYIYTVSGRGNFVSGNARVRDEIQVDKIKKEITSKLKEAVYNGVTIDELEILLSNIKIDMKGVDDVNENDRS